MSTEEALDIDVILYGKHISGKYSIQQSKNQHLGKLDYDKAHRFPAAYLEYISSFRQDRTIVIIAVEPVGLVGNREYAAVAADGLKAVGSLAVNSF